MFNKVNLLFLFLFSCVNEFIVAPQKIIEVEAVLEDSAPPILVESLETEVVIDYFEQPIKPEALDVLVVLDTSCSMRDDYEKLSIGLELLREDIELLTHDYQIGIINSSLAYNDSKPYFIGPFDRNTNSIDLLLAPAILFSDFYEVAFQSHYQFATSTSEGVQFLRNGVDKLIIYISDENEQSIIPVSTFNQWLEDYHQDVQYDVVSIAFVPTSDTSCAYSPSDIGVRYQELMNYYNKNVIDFCGDWQLALADSSFLLSETTHLKLSKIPIEDSIVVYQDGIEENMWYYLRSTNTVYFEFPMNEGAAIKVGYDSVVR